MAALFPVLVWKVTVFATDSTELCYEHHMLVSVLSVDLLLKKMTLWGEKNFISVEPLRDTEEILRFVCINGCPCNNNKELAFTENWDIIMGVGLFGFCFLKIRLTCFSFYFTIRISDLSFWRILFSTNELLASFGYLYSNPVYSEVTKSLSRLFVSMNKLFSSK